MKPETNGCHSALTATQKRTWDAVSDDGSCEVIDPPPNRSRSPVAASKRKRLVSPARVSAGGEKLKKQPTRAATRRRRRDTPPESPLRRVPPVTATTKGLCRVHGWADCAADNSKVAADRRAHRYPRCCACRELLDRLVSQATKRRCVIRDIDLSLIAAGPSQEKNDASSSRPCPKIPSTGGTMGQFARGRVTGATAEVTKPGGGTPTSRSHGAEFRLRIQCSRGHVFIGTERLLSMPGPWCNICAAKGTVSMKSRTQWFIEEQEQQQYQQQLFAQASLQFQTIRGQFRVTVPGQQPLPPSMRRTRRPSVSDPPPSANAPSGQPRHNVWTPGSSSDIVRLAQTDVSQYAGVTLEHAIPIIQILKGGSNPWTILQVRRSDDVVVTMRNTG